MKTEYHRILVNMYLRQFFPEYFTRGGVFMFSSLRNGFYLSLDVKNFIKIHSKGSLTMELPIFDTSGQDFLQNTLPDVVFLWFHVVEEVFGYPWMQRTLSESI